MTRNMFATHFDMTRQAVSKHIKILNECEMLTQKKQGRAIYYQLDMYKIAEVNHRVSQFRKMWKINLEFTFGLEINTICRA